MPDNVDTMGKGSFFGTLAASTVEEIIIPPGSGFNALRLSNRSGSAEIFYRLDGTDPTVGGAGCGLIPAAIGSQIISMPSVVAGIQALKIISTGTPTFGVEGVSNLNTFQQKG